MGSAPETETAQSKLATLYREIYTCERCIHDEACRMAPDPERVVRRPIAEALESEVMILGESLGAKTQRLSGIPYINPDGSLMETGRTLNGLLRQFGYTIRPGSDRRYAYSTDAVQRWPGLKQNGKKRDPSPQEVANCAPWFEAEVALVQPRVLLVMGLPAAKHFFRRYLDMRVGRLGEIAGQRFNVEVGIHHLIAYAIQHPSPLAQSPERTAVYKRVGTEIQQLLSE